MTQRARLLRYTASQYHYEGTSIPVGLFEELIAAGESPSQLYQEFNEDAGTNINLFPLLRR